jgi:nitronate monooxygenase
MARETAITRAWGVSHPLVQAPMAGASTVDLAAAVCGRGALGFIAAAYLAPQEIAEASAALRARTPGPFGVNLFAPLPTPDAPPDATAALGHVAAAHAALGLPAPAAPELPASVYEEQVEACLDSGASVFGFTFGIPAASVIDAIKRRGMAMVGTATTVAEARRLEEAGADAVVAQGSEAGGHRGTFATEFESAMIGTMALVPQVVDAVRVPVLAAGGIMDGRGIAAALALGASAAQMGTAFLTCDEAGIPEAHQAAILAAREHETRVTRAFSGRPARGIVNRLMEDVDRAGAVLPFPLQNALTRPLRSAAGEQGRAEFLSLWAGQGVRLARRQPAAALIARLAGETDAALARLTAPN